MNLKHLQFYLFFLVMICSCNYEDGIFTRDDLNENKNYRETLNFEKASKRNLIVKIESEDNFELSDIEFNLSRLFPTPIYYDEWGIDYTFRIPIPYKHTIPIPPSIQTGINYSTKFDFKNGKEYEFTIPENYYYASMENTNHKLNFLFNPIESKAILFLFGYDYDERHNGKYIQRNPNTLCYEVLDAEYLGKNHFSCPTILIEKGKTTELIIKIGKRKWSNASTILCKFIPGILGLGPFTNFGGYYFHRDYQIEIKTWTEND